MKLTAKKLFQIIKEELAEAPNFTKGARRSQPPEGGGPNFTKGDNPNDTMQGYSDQMDNRKVQRLAQELKDFLKNSEAARDIKTLRAKSFMQALKMALGEYDKGAYMESGEEDE